jgi:hypothetical protein
MKYKQGRKDLMAIKLDIEKAFNKMEWSFMTHILIKGLIGFAISKSAK